MLRGIEVGHRYVYFDSYVIPTDADGVTLEGLHSQHALAVVPQVEALRDRSIVDGLLSNPNYWRATALEVEG